MDSLRSDLENIVAKFESFLFDFEGMGDMVNIYEIMEDLAYNDFAD